MEESILLSGAAGCARAGSWRPRVPRSSRRTPLKRPGASGSWRRTEAPWTFSRAVGAAPSRCHGRDLGRCRGQGPARGPQVRGADGGRRVRRRWQGSSSSSSRATPRRAPGSQGRGRPGPRQRLQVHSPLPVLQCAQRQELDLQKQVPWGAAAFSAGVGSAGFGGGAVQPVASRTAASTARSFIIVPPVSGRSDSLIPHGGRGGGTIARGADGPTSGAPRRRIPRRPSRPGRRERRGCRSAGRGSSPSRRTPWPGPRPP